MTLIYTWLTLLLLLLGFFFWQAYKRRQPAGLSRNDHDQTRLILIGLMLVAVINFVLLLFYLLPKR